MKRIFGQVSGAGFDTMGMILIVWLCALPFIALIVVPLFGSRAGAGIALGLLLGMLLICWILCIPTALKLYRDKKDEVRS